MNLREKLHRCGRALAALLVLATAVALTGCQALLPEQKAELGISWKSYEEASRALDSIVPFTTRKSALAGMGLDPKSNPAITILSYPEILQRFAAGSVMRPEDFDPGIRQCLKAGKACEGYWIQVRKLHRERVGNFWLDSFAFRREVDISGWSFNALLLMIDDLVVYTVHGGQPGIKDRELVRNPLGPFQAWGEQVPLIIR